MHILCAKFLGEIVIQRLNWQKVFTLPAPEENVQVRSISWQQNATVLAVGKKTHPLFILQNFNYLYRYRLQQWTIKSGGCRA